MASPTIFLGLISGTSADGIDAALLRIDERPEVIAAATTPYPPGLRETILRVSQVDAAMDLDAFGHLDTAIGQAFADAAGRMVEAAGLTLRDIAAIGSHGQTLRHRPLGEHPFTLQVGDPSVIAERTGITVVADFRRRDVAAGGQGAPLMPAFHAAMFSHPTESRAVLNLGGIGNLTLLPIAGPVRGFDTGPANALMDAWCLRFTGEPFDRAGRFAASGRIDDGLLNRCLADPWFTLPPPKSSGRDQFHLDWLQARLQGNEPPEDVQATLCELSAATIAHALVATLPAAQRLLVCGGGVHNTVLLQRLARRLPGVALQSTAEHGIDPDAVEAAGFAWLAHQTLKGLPGNLPSVTGARGLRVLGAIHPGAAVVSQDPGCR